MANNFQPNEAADSALSIVPRDFNLDPDDISALEALGIPLELQREYIRRVSDSEGAEIVGQERKAGRSFSGLTFFLFTQPGQISPTDYELRRDEADFEIKDGEKREKAKYLRHSGRSGLLPIPKGITAEELNDISIPILICEGFKKFLAALWLSTYKLAPSEKRRFIPVAVTGAWNWRGKTGKVMDADGVMREIKGLIPAFRNITLKHRPVTICYDNDTETNYKVKYARQQFAETLESETGAVVYLVDLPKSDEKIGFDDFLGKLKADHGEDSALIKGLEFLNKKYRFSKALKSTLCDGQIQVFVSGAGRGKTKISVKNIDGAPLALDTFNVAEAEKRAKFVKQIDDASPLSDEQKKQIQRELMAISEISECLATKIEPAQTATEERLILSHILSDGRIIEALSTGVLAVYDSGSDSVEYAASVIDENICYKPLNDEITSDAMLVDSVEVYSNENELVEEIEAYISRHYDLDKRELKLASYYILLTYLSDSLYEVPYLHPQGASGSGKTRFGETIVSACYRPFFSFTATEASLFRVVDRYKPTLFLDEFNLHDSSDNAGIMQILNAGWSRLGKVRRCNDSGEIESFSPFGCKVIASLQKMKSDALESRCIPIQTRETTRHDIRFANVGQIQRDAIKLRRKLTMYRFRNLQRDFLNETIEAENELKKHRIRPRVIQKATPLFMLIRDTELRKQFIEILQAETRITRELNKESFDFEVTNAIHEILFDLIDENKAELRRTYRCELETLSPKLTYDVQTADGEVCEALTVENIVERVNAGKPDKEKIRNDRFGRTLSKRFNLETKVIWKRDSQIRGKRAIIFDWQRLAALFKNYSLPISADFTVATIASVDKPNETNGLSLATVTQKKAENDFTVASHSDNKINDLSELATVATADLPKPFGNGNGNDPDTTKRRVIEL